MRGWWLALQPTSNMLIGKIGQWLWENRRQLIIVVLFAVLLEFVFYLPFYLYWWAGALALVLLIGVWWLSGLSREFKRWLWLVAEAIWVMAAGVSFLVFNLVSQWQFHLLVILFGLLLFWMFRFYTKYLEEDSWPANSFSVLNFLNLLAFFFVSAGLMLAADFYTLELGLLMILFLAQILLAVNLRFWREGVSSLRKWFYVVLTAMVVEEALWIISSWHRGVYLKSFLLTIIFYVFTDFIMHYNRGTLTVKVALEYVGLATLLVIAMFVFDWLFILQ